MRTKSNPLNQKGVMCKSVIRFLLTKVYPKNENLPFKLGAPRKEGRIKGTK